MRCNSTIKRCCVMLSLIVFVIAFSGIDAFGQRWRRNDSNRQPVRPTVSESLKAEIILESNSSARTVWKHVATKGGEAPIPKDIERPKVPGGSTITSWNFDEMSKSSTDCVSKFRFTFFDSENNNHKAEFTFYPKEGKVQFVYNTSIGLN